MINAGKYRHQVTIKRPPDDSSRDTYGRRRKTPKPVLATVWAEKTDWSGQETDENGRETASVLTKFRIRYRTDVLPKMLVILGDEEWNILSVMDFDGTKRELTLNCRKVVA